MGGVREGSVPGKGYETYSSHVRGPTSISISDSVSLALCPLLLPPYWSVSDMSDSREHSEELRSRDKAPPWPLPAPASLSSQIRGKVGRRRSVGRNCFNVLRIKNHYHQLYLANIIEIGWQRFVRFESQHIWFGKSWIILIFKCSHLFDNFQTSLCL